MYAYLSLCLYAGHVFVDGSVSDKFPILFPIHNGYKRTLGIYLASDQLEAATSAAESTIPALWMSIQAMLTFLLCLYRTITNGSANTNIELAPYVARAYNAHLSIHKIRPKHDLSLWNPASLTDIRVYVKVKS